MPFGHFALFANSLRQKSAQIVAEWKSNFSQNTKFARFLSSCHPLSACFVPFEWWTLKNSCRKSGLSSKSVVPLQCYRCNPVAEIQRVALIRETRLYACFQA
jgi:hypothetical protein